MPSVKRHGAAHGAYRAYHRSLPGQGMHLLPLQFPEQQSPSCEHPLQFGVQQMLFTHFDEQHSYEC